MKVLSWCCCKDKKNNSVKIKSCPICSLTTATIQGASYMLLLMQNSSSRGTVFVIAVLMVRIYWKGGEPPI